MAAVWKIELFKKLSATEAECSKCNKKLQMKDSGTTGLLKHAKTHPEYAVMLAEIEEQAAAENNSMDKFVKVMPTGELSSLDKKVLHFVSCTSQPFSIVEAPTFKSLLPMESFNRVRC